MSWLVYGAYGYTGELVARLAVSRGERPILAGRDRTKLVALATELGLEHRVFDLRDQAAVRAGLDGVDVVAHCAGPFSATARPMFDACLATGTHYVDVNGEVSVFEALFARTGDAANAGVTALPGAGFDVVPTDCLAVYLSQQLPAAVSLELAFVSDGRFSPGTTRTALEGLGAGGWRRIDGVFRRTPIGLPKRRVPFPSGEREVSAIPWGDLATAYRSTGISTITTYTVMPARRLAAMAAPVLRLGPVRRLGQAAVARTVRGPDLATRSSGGCEVWGQVTDATGRTVSATLTTPNGYDLTADSVVRAVPRIAAGEVPAGVHTPATAFGPDYISTLDGTSPPRLLT